LFKNHPFYAARSAGTENGAWIRITGCHLGWADRIICMEKKHATRLRERFAAELTGKSLIILHIPDDYPFMDLTLVELLRAGLGTHLEF
jgi:predicted protein tyrosine phosphatase